MSHLIMSRMSSYGSLCPEGLVCVVPEAALTLVTLTEGSLLSSDSEPHLPSVPVHMLVIR